MRAPVVFLVKACILAIVAPQRFLKYQERRADLDVPAASNDSSVRAVRRAFWSSLGLVIASAAFGCIVGALLAQGFGRPSSSSVTLLQVLGSSVLLWGTLFVRGWDIQTFKGETLIELVNQLVFRTMYCIGTALLVVSVVWPTVASGA